MLLAGDIGGTKTNLGIFSIEKGPLEPLVEATFPSGQYPGLEALVEEFLKQTALKVKHACFGVAGTVIDDKAKITNLPWVVEKESLRKTLNLGHVSLLNDLEAIAYGVPLLGPNDLHTINKGIPVTGGTMAIIAPGTGLGEAFLIWDGARYRAYPSEGGHSDFAPNNPLEINLLKYLHKKWEHASYESVCSGQGLVNIYEFLKDTGYAKEPVWLSEQLNVANDPNPVIVKAALNNKKACSLCTATLDVFVSVLGAEAGNFALKVLATGGVYLGGGIPPKIIHALKDRQFMESFTRKGRFSELVSRIPVHIILNPNIALIGAASYGLELLEAHSS
ncbi:MAG TPA: glucokinase [Desulfatiglandales bacterium]|nr:glucokinase [Desulfatiglandales bacterium]